MPTATQPTFKSAWSKFNAIDGRWRGSHDQAAPTQDWWNALSDVITAMRENRPTNQFWQPFTDLVREYLRAADMFVRGEIQPFPTEETEKEEWEKAMGPLGRAISSLRTAMDREPIECKPMESIEELAATTGINGVKVATEQIARMWGLKEYLVSQIIAGKAKVPAGHVPPHQKVFEAQQRKLLRAYEDACEKWDANQPEEVLGDDWAPPPESIEELAGQGVDVEQISRMHRVPKETVTRVLAGETVGVNEDASEVSLEQLEAMTRPEAEATSKKGRK